MNDLLRWGGRPFPDIEQDRVPRHQTAGRVVRRGAAGLQRYLCTRHDPKVRRLEEVPNVRLVVEAKRNLIERRRIAGEIAGDGIPRDPAQRVLGQREPDVEGELAMGLQRPANLAKGAGLVGHEHEAKLTSNRVKSGIRKRQRLGLGWLPPGGRGDLVRDPLQELKFLLLPAVTLALPGVAAVSRLVKTAMLEVLGDDYVRTARAKGVTEPGVIWRHALRNSLVPVITLLGLQFGRLLGGAVITESVFSWPGLGRLIRDSIGNRDYAVVQASLLLLVLAFILINLVTDVSYGVLDPRIRISGGRAR